MDDLDNMTPEELELLRASLSYELAETRKASGQDHGRSQPVGTDPLVDYDAESYFAPRDDDAAETDEEDVTLGGFGHSMEKRVPDVSALPDDATQQERWDDLLSRAAEAVTD